MYKQGLYNHIETLLSDENIQLLNSFNEPGINKEIILLVLKSSRGLPYRLIPSLSERLKKLTTNDETITKRIDLFVHHHKQINYWEKRKIGIIFFIVLLLCLIIFLSAI